ncbi:hypothetical protein QJ043_04550 [Olsenella sp. YH-ols2217]|uniref:Uncharacterized protein n=1 Tax=Kribbibacterium absianum TaxID=3044210 RepID=A0ABT6ZJW2_9ACTN|nr:MULTISPECIES: hypothetical protein [unclassified Olsenella]MDJ1122399.1 hypothetical protein [Olsenella sp. YH-ols2216]MDJ1129347.1 hypothetical protein [Olsenella sp. YH-ols2217]
MGYWLLMAFQLFVCVISHSLALRTMIRLYAPVWLIVGSILLFVPVANLGRVDGR